MEAGSLNPKLCVLQILSLLMEPVSGVPAIREAAL
jgi:hypothetical protein